MKRSTGRVHQYFLIWGFVCFLFASRPARSSSPAATIGTYGGRCIICGSPRYACCRLPSFSSFFEHGFTPQGSRTLIQVTMRSVCAWKRTGMGARRSLTSVLVERTCSTSGVGSVSRLSLSPFVMRRWTDSSFIRVQLERRAKYTCCFISYICSPSTLAGYYRFFFRAMAR